MPDRVRLRDSLIPETARLIRDQQSLRWGLTLRRATAATIAKRFSGVLGMFSSLEVKVLYPT